jgi:hypothetical protein
VTPGTFSRIVHLIAKKTLEQAQTPGKPPTDLDELTISHMDPLVM